MVALVRLEVGHMLHAGLDPLRHELRLLLGRLQGGEGFADPFAVPVMGNKIALPAL